MDDFFNYNIHLLRYPLWIKLHTAVIAHRLLCDRRRGWYDFIVIIVTGAIRLIRVRFNHWFGRWRLLDILERACEIFSQQLKVRGITVEWEITPPLPFVMTDPGRLEQVFINLLINARDAIEAKAEAGA